MKHQLNTDEWNRKEHFNFFKQFQQPYYGITVQLNCTRAYQRAKQLGVSFYSYYLHKTLVAVNTIENFRYRIENDAVFVYDQIDASSTILRDDHTFGFSHIKYSADIHQFHQNVQQEITRIKTTTGLFTTAPVDNIVHFSALPWIDFTSITQSTNFNVADSCPKFSVGKLTTEEGGQKRMPFTVDVHHALVDGYHVGLFLDKLTNLMKE